MENVEKDKQRAEVFDALGHPTRITILKVLSEVSLGFADLKKRTGIESSGHLQHHLSKLGGLIKTDEHGKYCLSDQGRDALFTVQTVEKAAEPGAKETGRVIRAYGLKTKTILASIVALLAIASLFGGFYISNIWLIQSQYSYDVIKGSPLKESAPIRVGPVSFEMQPEHSFNYTAVIFLEPSANTSTYIRPTSATLYASSPIHNSTFYRHCFLGFYVELRTEEGKILDAFFKPLVGPNDTTTETVINPYGFPPYETRPSTGTIETVSGGLQMNWVFIVPVNVDGNYTFSVANISNSTINGQITVWTSTVTMETKPLRVGETFPSILDTASERIARINWKPSFLYLIATGVVVVSPLIIGVLGIYFINRKR
ncbi:MAG: winged helix-turn-helix domain-containing protein [Candidatus Bathyarchaeota archaeon]|nr:winged helix-turn-helix domain-containing protein [Candidatus Bathyarchaeota archaeon]MDH5664319.1 winged helix-turn-helix domain-containing protein [Candidatus Bathyarchaeota archaeon]